MGGCRMPSRILLLILLLACTPGPAFSQIPSGRERSARAPADTTTQPGIEYTADTINYEFSDSTLVLSGRATLRYDKIELSAGQVKYHTHTELLTADFLPDTTDATPNVNIKPTLKDEGGILVGERMEYDLKTSEGRIWKGRTEYEEGFFDGDLIQLNADRTFEIEGGTYTTCDNPDHLHYFLKIGKARVVPDDKAVVRNVTGYIFGIPVMYLPVYVFSVKRGRHSGLTIPSYGNGEREGRYLRNLGYYWAPNEYLDLKLTGDVESKTGFLLKQRMQYRQGRRLRGTVGGSWQSSFGGETNGWDVSARHWQQILPGLTLRGQATLAKSLRYLNSTTRGTDPGRLRSTRRSGFSLNRRWGRNSVDLNMSTTSTDDRPSRPTSTLSFRFATRPIFKPPRNQYRRGSMPDFNRVRTDDEARWYHSILFGFNNSLRDRRNSIQTGTDTTYAVDSGDTTTVLTPVWRRDVNRTLTNRFSLSAPQNLFGWLKIRPQARYARNWIKMSGEDLESKEEHTVGMSVNTTLYGLFQPRIGRLTAIRHVVTPLVSFNQSGPTNIRKAVRFSLDNILQAKTERDGREKKYNLVYLRSSTSYNFKAKTRRLADLATSVRIPNRRLNVNVSMNHDFYDPGSESMRRPWLERLVVNTSLNLVGSRRSDRRDRGRDLEDDDPLGRGYSGDDRGYSGSPLSGGYDRDLGSSSRLSGSGGFGSGLDSGGYSSGFGSSSTGSGFGSGGLGSQYDSGGYGSGFGSYGGYGFDRFDQRFGQVKGPWTVRLTHRYTIRRTSPDQGFSTSSHEIRAVNRFSLNDITDPLRISNRVTDGWRIQHAVNYDYRRRKIVSHSLDVYRQLHCWEFTLRWVPTGINKGIYFRLNIMAHPDVKIEQERRSGS